MDGPLVGFWGKLNRNEDGSLQWHPLADHCADVAAVCEALLSHTLIGRRLARLGERDTLSESDTQRLAALAAFHDVGKFNIGFQNKADPDRRPQAGHVSAVLALLGDIPGPEQDRLLQSMPLDEITSWAPEQGGLELLVAAVGHHGRPSAVDSGPGPQRDIWQPSRGRDPFAGIAELSAKVRTWFPDAFRRDAQPLPSSAPFQHAFCGLVTVADWIGSNRELFHYSRDTESDRFAFARAMARAALREIGIDPRAARESLGPGAPEFSAIAGFPPRAAQRRLLELAADSRGSLSILESETGSGKTEAALARFLRLFQAGEVDGLYFALPTRTAAVQIHDRVTAAIRRAFPDQACRPPVILAVPGYIPLDAGRHRELLEPFSALWNDDPAERFRFHAWASEHPKRYLAGAISIGTVDQALLSALAVSHSHMRATALLRQLLVVDEVHASDAYMAAILRPLLKFHLDAGGHALLLSATLGSGARSKLFGAVGASPGRPPSLADATATKYPLLSAVAAGRGIPGQEPLPAETRPKVIRRRLTADADQFEKVAAVAIDAARHGARVLIVRNTVRDCVRTQLALEAAAHTREDADLLFALGRVIAPHHARFSREDRQLLDQELERRFGIGSSNPCAAVATQTVQQSLDIDADLMLTDLCPIDVMLQRIGRLHRHQRVRPKRFASPEVIVITPAERGLGSMIRTDGKASGEHGLGTVYDDLRMIEAAWRALEAAPVLEIPAMNRRLVEAGTHTEVLDAIVRELGGVWKKHAQVCAGTMLAQRGLARLGLVDRSQKFGRYQFPSLDRRIQTRLGQDDRIIELPQPLTTPFGAVIRCLVAPAWLVGGAAGDAVPEEITIENRSIKFRFGGREFIYDRLGLRPTDSSSADVEEAYG